MSIPVSILLLTLNEELNLPRCLEAITWCDDIVVLDSYSTDRTVAIAKAAGARVFDRTFDNFAGQRNWALENVPFQHDWILHLDADEVCTPGLLSEIVTRIGDSRYGAYRIPSKMIFLGKWLRFAGMYPSYQVRLGRNPVFRFKQVGHGQRENIDPARVGTLRHPYIHHSFSKGLHDWFAKHNRYSSDEATELAGRETTDGLDLSGLVDWRDPTRRRRAIKAIVNRLPFRPTLRFFYMYFGHFGFLDGSAGYQYCRLLAMYQAMIDMKVGELRRREQEVPPGDLPNVLFPPCCSRSTVYGGAESADTPPDGGPLGLSQKMRHDSDPRVYEPGTVQ
ncbi:MAG: glycosyltransferase family 2 protein [Thermoguttaceae bacterium]|jgi:glycosyltransferase involved in cell wall biosynthesis